MRASEVARAPVRHVTLPFCVTGSAAAQPRETIGAFLDRTGWAVPIGARWSFQLPTICVVNGQPLPQRQWKRRRIRAADVIEFWSRPWGGAGGTGSSGKQVLGLVAIIALAAFAPWAGGLLAGAMGLGTLGASVISGAILMGGALLVSALTRPKAGGQSEESNDQIEQLNSVSATGNTARLFQPIPVQYGRVKSFPDYAVTPWSEFIGNDQYLNVLLAQGEGRHSYEALYVDDTVMWTSSGGLSATFTGVDLAFYDPGQPVTLFPLNVLQSSEVSGQTLPTPSGGNNNGWIGFFAAATPGTTTTFIATDLVFPAGAWILDVNGMHSVSVPLAAEYQAINDAGTPIGPVESLWSQNFTYATRTPQRFTVKTQVPPGRYQVRVRRIDSDYQDITPPAGTSGANTVIWAGLRAFIDGPSSFPCSTVGFRIKATSQLTQTSARRFGVLSTRILNVWDAGTQTFVPTATRNALWAVWDAATNVTYGINRPPSKVDFQTIFDQAVAADARGDHFDFRFVSAVPAPEALDTILRAARARHRWSGDVLTFVRDEWSSVPRMLLTDREIVRGTLAIEYALNVDDSADAVIVEYLDEGTWSFADVQYPPNTLDFTAENPTRIRVDGVVNRNHAYREAGFYYLQSQLRRVSASLDTEHDGRMLGFGSRVRVQTELPLSWGSTGYVESRTGNVLQVSPTPTWGTGNHYIAIRTKTGRQFGPILCTQGLNASRIVLNTVDLAAVEVAQGMTLADALARADGADDPSFDFGPGESRARDCIVMTGRPSRDRVTLGLVVDRQGVHDTDLGGTPVAPTLPTLRDPATPTINNLFAHFRQGVAEPILDASWWPAAGAQYYVGEVSYDGGASWTPVYEGAEPQLSSVVDRAALRLRVQGVGARRGAFSFVDIAAPTIIIAPNTVDQASLERGLRDYVTRELKNSSNALRNIAQLIASYAADQDAANYTDKVETRRLIKAANADIFAAIEQVETVAISTQAAFAQWEVTVSAQYDDFDAFVQQTATAVATVNGEVGALYALSVNAGGKISGFKLGNDGTTSQFEIEADVFRVGVTGAIGGTFVPVFQVATVNGVTKLALRGDMLIDGTITALKLAVASVTAGKIAAGAVNATNIIAEDIIVTGQLKAEAATAVNFIAGSNNSAPANSEVELCSVPINVVSGKVLIDGQFIVDGPASNISTQAASIIIKIDGAAHRTKVISPVMIQFAASENFYKLLGIQTITSLAVLSPGVHTLSLWARASASFAIAFQEPVLRTLESRR